MRGSITAPRTWRQVPSQDAGRVLAATTDSIRGTIAERLVHQTIETSMAAVRCESRSRVVRQADVDAVPEVADLDPVDVHDWALAEFRSTSPWAVAHAVAADRKSTRLNSSH